MDANQQKQDKSEKKETTEKSNETAEKTETKDEQTTATEEKTSAATNTGDKKLANGIEYKDIKIGKGPDIKFGQQLHILYAGQLEDKTVFDKNLTGSGFEYKFGSDSGIKGWHLGMKGMKVGGKRRIVIPAKLAYGEEGCPEKNVPANATLTFTMEIIEPKEKQ